MTKPLLTPAEKAFLQAVIKPYKRIAFAIIKENGNEYFGTYRIKIKLDCCSIFNDILLPIDKYRNSYQFKGLELNTTYDLKTLGL